MADLMWAALPGCHSQGDTEEDAMENIKDAIMGCLEALNQRAMVRDVTERIVEVALAWVDSGPTQVSR